MDGRKIILGVTGGIAAYKSPLLVRLLKKAGADVQVVMTRDARRFVTATTLGTVSEREVLVDIFPDNTDGRWTKHVELGLWADLLVVAPATAQTVAKLANGFCDNMLTAVALSARCPILVCPAMDHDMFVHPATGANLDRLRRWGYRILQPERGELASGLVGEGRMPEPEAILSQIKSTLATVDERRGDLFGRHVLVTAGPTREAIDPVRYISNRSSGRMGYAVAAAAARRGATVTLVSGPVSLEVPAGVEVIRVVSAVEMFSAVQSAAAADVVVMAAAVADFTPVEVSDRKLKKEADLRGLQLEPTVDILAWLGSHKPAGQFLAGFALETDDEIENAKKKLESKNLDLIVANNPLETGAGFDGPTNRVTLVSAAETTELPLLTKEEVAERILDRVAEAVGVADE